MYFYAIEIGFRGYIDKDNEGRINTIFRSISSKFEWCEIKVLLYKLAILGSFTIYNSRLDHNWCAPVTLKPNVVFSRLVRNKEQIPP